MQKSGDLSNDILVRDLSKVATQAYTELENISENAPYRITPMEIGVDPIFIDIKVTSPMHVIRSAAIVGGSLYLNCMKEGHPIFYRRSIGFYHPNFGILFGDEGSTLRLTLGIDPTQVDLIAKCFEEIDALNP